MTSKHEEDNFGGPWHWNAERNRRASETRQNNYRNNIFRLFDAGKTPDNITTKDLAYAFGINTEDPKLKDKLKKKVKDITRTLWRQTPGELIPLLYKKWKESKSENV